MRRILPAGTDEAAFAALVQSRLEALAERASGHEASLRVGAADRALARRVLSSREGSWHDGDENLVRGLLGDWRGARERPRALLDAADAVSRIAAPPQTLWCFLWLLESSLGDLE